MKRAGIFYLVFILTVLAIRLEVFLFPYNKLILGGVPIRHFWIGILLIVFVLLLSKRYNALRIIMLSIGIGLAADELAFIVLGGTTVNDYWSLYSVSGVLVMTAIIFAARNRLVKKLYENST